jgi:hypothetical protein
MPASNRTESAADLALRKQSLEGLLASCRNSAWPGSEALLKAIQSELARIEQQQLAAQKRSAA